MAKLKINERTVEGLQLEINHHKKEKSEILRENDSLRSDNQMLFEVIEALVDDPTYWKDTVEAKTMIFRVKNILNSLKSR
jgi:FtsZ-binding cell division protein ZapB